MACERVSAIFSDLTHEYELLELDGNVKELEFQAVRAKSPDHRVDETSRATVEQLILPVRLAGIRQTEVSPPVVLDDAATNFDPNHGSRAFDSSKK